MAETSPRTSSEVWRSFKVAAWLGWLFDGLDMHLYTIVAAPFVAQLLAVADVADPAVKAKSSWIQAAFLVGWALSRTVLKGELSTFSLVKPDGGTVEKPVNGYIVDADGDTFGTGPGCAAYDCDDTDAAHWDDCRTCVDPDGDGRPNYDTVSVSSARLRSRSMASWALACCGMAR